MTPVIILLIVIVALLFMIFAQNFLMLGGFNVAIVNLKALKTEASDINTRIACLEANLNHVEEHARNLAQGNVTHQAILQTPTRR